MEQALTILLLAWTGLLLGSFAGAQVWRLRAAQLKEDKSSGEKVSEPEYAQLSALLRPIAKDRSECLNCHHKLAWYDLVPVASWVLLGGRCRYCRNTIGIMEPFTELGTMALFVISYLAWPVPLMLPVDVATFVVWLIVCIVMVILFVYDAKWSLLPFKINILFIITSALFLALAVYSGLASDVTALSIVLSLAIVAGLYFLFSLAGWSGLGDSILGIGLALLLAKWELAFLAVFLANLLGTLMLIPLLISNKLQRGLHIPFGPFLITGTIIAYLWGSQIIVVGMKISDYLLTALML
ncbi:prepilin peptidase [Candidatus Saccharibacteria bacterium]|nr:prepilin peptidase [Candidatus Saccharibacteria bacterium]